MPQLKQPPAPLLDPPCPREGKLLAVDGTEVVVIGVTTSEGCPVNGRGAFTTGVILGQSLGPLSTSSLVLASSK